MGNERNLIDDKRYFSWYNLIYYVISFNVNILMNQKGIKDMTTSKRTLKTPNRLSYNTYGTDKEYIERLEKHLLSPLQGMEMMEGDMCMSDYRSLLQGKWLIENKDQ